MNQETFSARVAARICGFETVAMLDYLQRSEVFIPRDRANVKRRGKGRRYNFRELLVLKTIATLLKNGASVASLKKSLNEFQTAKWRADPTSLYYDEKPLKYFIVSSGHVYFARSSDNLYDLTMNGQLVFNFIIDLDKLHSELCYSLKQNILPLKMSG